MTDATAADAPTPGGSIRRRLTRRLLIQMLTVAVVSNALLYLYLRGELVEQYDQSLTTESLAVVSLIESESPRTDLSKLVARSFPRLRLNNDQGGYLQVWRPDKTVALRSPSMGDRSFDLPSSFKSRGRVQIGAITLPDGDGGRSAWVKVDENGKSRMAGWMLLLAEPSTELDSTLLSFAVSLTVIATAMSVFAVALVVHGVRRELRPLDAFADAVGALRAETLGFRFDESTLAEELVPIARRMNDLLGRLGEAFDRERRFSGNLAHELRTPIAEMRTMLEVASRWPPDAEGVAKLHHDVLAVAVRTSSLLDALLATLRHQQGRQAIVLEPTPLRACIDEAWEAHAAVASDRGLRLQTDVPGELAVSANRAALVALLSNLLENAASYGVAGSAIDVRSSTDAGAVTLVIENETSDLSASDLPHLHEPFWRKDAARVDRSHAGLGLALVREYAAAMRIDLKLTMPKDGRLAARLTWPQ